MLATQDETLGAAITIYPNPVQGQLMLESKEMLDEISISDVMGNIVYKATNFGYKSLINAEDFMHGVYFLTVSKGNRRYTSKLVKN